MEDRQIDRKKVIEGLAMCAGTNVASADDMNVCILDCPYRDKSNICIDNLMFDALVLLKKQEPALPTWSQGKAYCGKCGHRLPRKRADKEINYCGYCGQEVKWNG